MLQIAQIPWLNAAAPLFETIKDITHLFYNRISNINDVQIDFAFLIASFAILFIVWGIKLLIEKIELIEEKYDATYKTIKKKAEENFNVSLEKQYIKNEHKNNKFLVMVKLKVRDLSVDAFFSRDTTPRDTKKELEIMSNFMEILDEDLPCQKKLFDDNLLLYFPNFDKINETLDNLRLIIKNLKNKHLEDKWQITASVGVDTYAGANEIAPKAQKLILLNKLGLDNKILCLSSFRQRYSLLKEKKYNIEVEGAYKLGENEEEVSIIKS